MPSAVRIFPPARPAALVLALVLGLVLGLSACQVDIEVDIGFNEDGSGLVTVAVALDEQAAGLAPGITSLLLTDDIENPDSGWVYNDPRIDERGRTSFSASKPFGSPEQLESVLSEIFGSEDAFRDFTFERDTSFAQTDYRVTGVVDLSEGLDLLADAELTERLGGNPLGQPMDDSDLSAALAGVTVDIVLDLPAGVDESLTIGLGKRPRRSR